MRSINKIIIHCTATPEGRETSVAEVDSWHKKRGFSKIGYHYLIAIDGTIGRGRDEEEVGAHCKGYNTNSIGVSYVGGLDRQGKSKDTRTKEQEHALKVVVESLKDKYEGVTIHGHNEFSSKACPSFNVQEWIKEIGL